MNPSNRTLNWADCYNVRDLGGLPLAGGGVTRSGRLIRSDLIGRLTAEGRKQLIAYGVGAIVDLRLPHEIAAYPQADFSAEERAPRIINRPAFNRSLREKLDDQFKRAETRAELYNLIIDHFAANTVSILGAISSAAPRAVLFHCHSGKDRTGVIAALLLELAGVQRAAIAGDYARSQEQLWPYFLPWAEAQGGVEKVDRWSAPITEPQTMLEMLAHIDRKHGGVEAYLLQAGQTPAEIAALKTILI